MSRPHNASIDESEYPQSDDIQSDRYRIDQSDEHEPLLHGFQIEHEYDCHEEMEIPKKKDEPDAGKGEHEHDLDVPSHHGAQGGVSRRRPEGGALRQMKDPAVPGLIYEIHSEKGEAGENSLPVARPPGPLDLDRVDIQNDRQKRYYITLQS